VTEDQAIDLLDRSTPQLLELPGVCGVGIAENDESGQFIIWVLLKDDQTPALFQKIADILRVDEFETVVTGPFDIYLT
jgi:hypothetical protein